MPDYDPTTVALVGEMLKVLDAEADAETMSYEDQLRAVQHGLTEALQTGDGEEPSPEDEQVMRQALGRLDPKHGDAQLGYGRSSSGSSVRSTRNSLSGPLVWCNRQGRVGMPRSR